MKEHSKTLTVMKDYCRKNYTEPSDTYLLSEESCATVSICDWAKNRLFAKTDSFKRTSIVDLTKTLE
jgi:hypothetical protein